MQRPTPTAERLSVALGLCVVMLATLPRYLAGGHESRQTLILIALGVVALATFMQWRILPQDARARLPGLLKRLVGMLVVGSLLMGLWHWLFTDWISWQVLVSHGATLGLLLHVLSLWWSSETTEASG
ncbi:hypothetical protein VRRI112168_16765 [Vreelandella rituensis]|uniref:Transmembrane protein n=1 Tax=Vreelandella rituensis TaxID=2282306 RepID=A0A368U2C8_9GAMM|nr:hypothetical protein [Halomonas rituensis]RCV90706.1 hypothetical protein DU506_11310 [Halomonas rituensis]